MTPSPCTRRNPGLALLAMLALAALPGTAGAIAMRNMDLMAHVDGYPPPFAGATNYSACWSYVHPDGREYAVIGVGDGNGGSASEGTAIYNVTDPAAPALVGFIPGPASIWREMKQYRSWIYVVTEGFGTGEGLQIIRMTDPQNPVLAATYVGGFHRSHTVSVDTSRALLICNGTRVNAGSGAYPSSGMRLLSLANPEAPAEIATWPASMAGVNVDSVYIHDSVPVGNRLYASSIYPGIHRIFDISNPAAPVQLAAWGYPGGFTHNSWPDKTGNWLYVTDEKNGEPLKVFDISNLSAPVLWNGWMPNPIAIVHNVHVWGDEMHVSSYTEGVRLLDISDPAHPAEFAWADTYEGASGDYNGVWEVSQFPSGTVIASDRQSGLWVFRPRRDYGLARVKVVDAATQQPLGGVKVFRGADVESLATTADGVCVFALDPGSHSLTARAFGYQDASAPVTASVGSRDTITLALSEKPKTSFTGTVWNAALQAPLADAEVVLRYTPLHDHTDGAGQFSLAEVPTGTHRVEVRASGFVPVAFDFEIGPGPTSMNFSLPLAAYWNAMETATEWTVGDPTDTANDPFHGQWIHADPIGSSVSSGGPAPVTAAPEARAGGLAPLAFDRVASPAHEGHREAEGLRPGPVQPEDDRTPSGTKCFMTGQSTVPTSIENRDLDGRTTLTSPRMIATGMIIPTVGFWRWFYSSTGESTDYLAVLLSNDDGVTWVSADTIRGHQGHWEEEAIRIADHIPPTNFMRVRFVAADEGGFSVVEVLVDDLTVYDAATQPVGAFPEPAPARLAFRNLWPNPARGSVRAVLDLPRSARVEAEVLDVQGRVVAKVFDAMVEAGPVVMAWDGRGAGGSAAGSGVYFLRARVEGQTVTARFVNAR